MAEPIRIEDYSPEWPEEFLRFGLLLRAHLGDLAPRIDHIGSTSIPGLAAKPIVDIQVSVASFGPMAPLEAAMNAAGFIWRRDNPDLTKRYFREGPGARRTHIHIRRLGSWHEQWALLFRDYMRAHIGEHEPYALLKRRLAAEFGADRQGYTDAKDEHFWAVIRRADRWAAETGWVAAASDV